MAWIYLHVRKVPAIAWALMASPTLGAIGPFASPYLVLVWRNNVGVHQACAQGISDQLLLIMAVTPAFFGA